MANERGVAMITVMGVAGVLFGATSLIAVQGINNLRQASGERLFEQALHVADAGVDRTLFEVRETKGTYTTGETTPADFSVYGGEKAWVIQTAEAAVDTPAERDLRLNTTREGQWVAFRPVGAAVVYSVSRTPSWDAPQRERVLRAEYSFGPFTPNAAIMAGGNVKLGGDLRVEGAAGSAYASGDITVESKVFVSGYVAASGTYHNNNPDQSEIGDPANSGGGKPRREIPQINPRDNYHMSEYDLCPGELAGDPGRVLAGPAYTAGPEEPSTGLPCTGEVLVANAKDTPFRGWRWNNYDAVDGHKWQWTGSFPQGGEVYNGVYYALNGGFEASGNLGQRGDPWKVTLIAEAGETTGSHCPHLGGDIVIAGNPYMEAHELGGNVLFLAGRDIRLQGSAAGFTEFNFTGAIAAHEQIDSTSNPRIKGPIIAENACETPNSEVQGVNSITGSSPYVFYDGGEYELGNSIRVTLWSEL